MDYATVSAPSITRCSTGYEKQNRRSHEWLRRFVEMLLR